MRGVVSLVLFTSILAQGSAAQQQSSAAAANVACGYFEGTATSRQAGILKVALNLRCQDSGFAGELVTPVGRFDVVSGTFAGDKLNVTFSAGVDQGTLETELHGGRLQGKFVLGDDSGPVELVRSGDARSSDFDKPTLKLTPAQWREDLAYFASELPKQHANAYYHISKEQFQREVANADRKLGDADGDEAYVAIDRIANAIGDGHTFVIWPDDLSHFPLDVRLFEGAYRVAGVLPGNERALGARIVKIGDVPLERVVMKLRDLTPAAETKMLGDVRMEDFLTIGMLLHGLGIIRDRKVASYTLVDESEKEFAVTLSGMTMEEVTKLKWIRPFNKRPLYLENRDSDLWCEFLHRSETTYCSFRGYDQIAQNAARLIERVKLDHAKKLAIDMRFNLGGDYTLGQKYLIEPLRVFPEINKRGHLFVLVSGYTFSAGMSNASQFRTQTNAVLVGETIGERPNSYQEARELRLPNSHLVVRVSTQYYKFAPTGENLIRPDREIRCSWEAYKAGKDPVLDWVEAQ